MSQYTTFAVSLENRGAHTLVAVFAGPEDGIPANCGALVMRPHEADAFVAELKPMRLDDKRFEVK